jgi:FKBP-type peptidyl-prolyl cis-trans isomerase FklB
MKNVLRTILAAGLGLGCFQLSAPAQTNGPASAPPKDSPEVQKEKVSYAIGMNWGQQLKRAGFDVDVEVIANAIKETMAGKTPKYTEMQAREALNAYQMDLRKKKDEERVKLAEKNKKEGEAFLAANKSKPGVKTKTVELADGKTAEMQYKVITEGTGAMPHSNDVVSVNYRGTLINGKEFDSSAKHGQLKRPANSLIRGWTEALQMMKTGSKWELYLPSTLAYSDFPMGQDIEPGSTLIFEVELVGVEAPPPPPPPAAPLTSDIIKVPSAEELKKGAKIEVLKPEEAAKLAAEQQAKETNKAEKK